MKCITQWTTTTSGRIHHLNIRKRNPYKIPIFLVRANHPSNARKGGVYIYFKNSIPWKVLDIQLLQECINFEIKIADKICSFISLHRSPCQSKDGFESSADNLELNLDSIVHRNPYLIVVLGDFNAQTKGLCPLGKTTYEGTRTDGIRSQFWLEQLIHEPTQIIGERSSCRFNFCFSTKFGGEIRCPIFFTSKLSSPNSVCNIQSQSSFSTSIWAWSIAY